MVSKHKKKKTQMVEFNIHRGYWGIRKPIILRKVNHIKKTQKIRLKTVYRASKIPLLSF